MYIYCSAIIVYISAMSAAYKRIKYTCSFAYHRIFCLCTALLVWIARTVSYFVCAQNCSYEIARTVSRLVCIRQRGPHQIHINHNMWHCVGYVISMSIVKQFAMQYRYKVDANQGIKSSLTYCHMRVTVLVANHLHVYNLLVSLHLLLFLSACFLSILSCSSSC